jgi:hypothetical protein
MRETKKKVHRQFLAILPYWKAWSDRTGAVSFVLKANTRSEALQFPREATEDERRLVALIRQVLPKAQYTAGFPNLDLNARMPLTATGCSFGVEPPVRLSNTTSPLRIVDAKSRFVVRIEAPAQRRAASRTPKPVASGQPQLVKEPEQFSDREFEALIAQFRDPEPAPQNEPMKNGRKKSA